MYRQGDVLLVPAPMPENVKRLRRSRRGIVLAEGEATGHAHVVRSRTAVLVQDLDTEWAYLQTAAPCIIEHEEHAPIELPAGTYRVVRQVEYTPQEIRRVAD